MNPLEKWRSQHQLSRRALALAAGVSYGSVYGIETGLVGRLHPRVIALVQEIDGSPAAQSLAVEWKSWRDHLAHEAHAAVVR